MDTQTQAQIIVDFVREGPDRFWNKVKTLHHLDDAQLRTWIQHPNTYKNPDGTAPEKPKPDSDNFHREQYQQIERILTQIGMH